MREGPTGVEQKFEGYENGVTEVPAAVALLEPNPQCSRRGIAWRVVAGESLEMAGAKTTGLALTTERTKREDKAAKLIKS